MRRKHAELYRSGGIVTLLLAMAGCGGDATEPSVRVLRLEAETARELQGTVRTAVVPAPTVRVLDEDGEPLAGIVVRFGVTHGGAVGVRSYTTEDDGLASVGSWILGGAAVTQLLSAGVGAVWILFEATAAPGAPAEIVVVGGAFQSGVVGETLPEELRVVVLDWEEVGNAVPGAAISFTVLSGGGTISRASAAADINGIASGGRWTLGSSVGAQEVLVESGSGQAIITAYASPGPD
jgi:hypothetical protein